MYLSNELGDGSQNCVSQELLGFVSIVHAKFSHLSDNNVASMQVPFFLSVCQHNLNSNKVLLHL